jgi:hypothetical protein
MMLLLLLKKVTIFQKLFFLVFHGKFSNRLGGWFNAKYDETSFEEKLASCYFIELCEKGVYERQ